MENMIRIEEEIQKFCNELEELGESRGNASEEIREKEKRSGNYSRPLKSRKSCLRRSGRRFTVRLQREKN